MKRKFTVENEGTLAAFLCEMLAGVSREHIRIQIKRGEVRINGEKTKSDCAVTAGDEVEVFLEAVLPASNRRGYLEYWRDIPAGVCHVNLDDDEVCIYGLGVLKEYRGKGLGKLLVRYILNEMAGGREEIVIEVDSENQRAYHLYLSCGFEVEHKTDYYEEDISAES